MDKSVEKYLAELPQLSRADVEHLREWHQKQPHLPPVTDEELVMFLHCSDYSLERAKACVDKHYTMRTHAQDIFGRRDVLLPENVAQEAFLFMGLLPRSDARGRRLLALGLRAADDLAAFDAARCMFGALARMDVLARAHLACPGYAFVLDAQHLQLGHIARAPVPLLRTLLIYVQEALPLRMRAVHVVHVNPLVEKVMLLIKPFLGEELRAMLHFHSGAMEALYEALPRDLLPREFGGTCGSVMDYDKELTQQLLAAREEVLALGAAAVDERLRPGRARGAAGGFGADGSFRRMDID